MVKKISIFEEGKDADKKVFFQIDEEEKLEMSFDNLVKFGERVLKTLCADQDQEVDIEYNATSASSQYVDTLRAIVAKIKEDQALQQLCKGNTDEGGEDLGPAEDTLEQVGDDLASPEQSGEELSAISNEDPIF